MGGFVNILFLLICMYVLICYHNVCVVLSYEYAYYHLNIDYFMLILLYRNVKKFRLLKRYDYYWIKNTLTTYYLSGFWWIYFKLSYYQLCVTDHIIYFYEDGRLVRQCTPHTQLRKRVLNPLIQWIKSSDNQPWLQNFPIRNKKTVDQIFLL